MSIYQSFFLCWTVVTSLEIWTLLFHCWWSIPLWIFSSVSFIEETPKSNQMLPHLRKAQGQVHPKPLQWIPWKRYRMHYKLSTARIPLSQWRSVGANSQNNGTNLRYPPKSHKDCGNQIFLGLRKPMTSRSATEKVLISVRKSFQILWVFIALSKTFGARHVVYWGLVQRIVNWQTIYLKYCFIK